jgi:hypothetical protein
VHPIGQLTNIRRSDGAPVEVDTSGRIYDNFLRLVFLYAVHHKASALPNDIPEESCHFFFLRVACLANIKGSVGLILAKASDMRISISLDSSCHLGHLYLHRASFALGDL